MPHLDPRITAVIATHNRAQLVERAVASVLAQSRPPAELIVVDDGSTDGTQSRLASLAPRVRTIHQDHAGAAAARNHGVRQARSAWIAFLDSDDVWLDGHLARMAAAIQATGGAARFYFSDALLTEREGGGRLWARCGFAVQGQYELALDATDWVVMSWPPMLLQASVINRETYLACGGLWERLPTRHDTHLFLRLGMGAPACAVAGCGVRMTADDPDHRLTLAQAPADSRGHLERVLMFQDLLRRCPALTPAARRELRRRLASAHRRLARLAWGERRFLAAARHAAHSAALGPRRFLAQCGRCLAAPAQGAVRRDS